MKAIIQGLYAAAVGYFIVSACRIAWRLVTVDGLGLVILGQTAIFLLIAAGAYLVIRRSFKRRP